MAPWSSSSELYLRFCFFQTAERQMLHHQWPQVRLHLQSGLIKSLPGDNITCDGGQKHTCSSLCSYLFIHVFTVTGKHLLSPSSNTQRVRRSPIWILQIFWLGEVTEHEQVCQPGLLPSPAPSQCRCWWAWPPAAAERRTWASSHSSTATSWPCSPLHRGTRLFRLFRRLSSDLSSWLVSCSPPVLPATSL